MINRNLLKSEIVKNGLTQAELCQKIGMAHSSFIRKMKNGVFTTDEAEKLINVLGIQNPVDVFFATKLT